LKQRTLIEGGVEGKRLRTTGVNYYKAEKLNWLY